MTHQMPYRIALLADELEVLLVHVTIAHGVHESVDTGAIQVLGIGETGRASHVCEHLHAQRMRLIDGPRQPTRVFVKPVDHSAPDAPIARNTAVRMDRDPIHAHSLQLGHRLDHQVASPHLTRPGTGDRHPSHDRVGIAGVIRVHWQRKCGQENGGSDYADLFFHRLTDRNRPGLHRRDIRLYATEPPGFQCVWFASCSDPVTANINHTNQIV